MNKVILLGRLTADPTTTVSAAGNAVTRFSIAVDRRFKQENAPTADFPSCVAFGNTAAFINKYFHKGMKIALEGRLQTGSYEKDGVKHYTTDVIVESVEFAESKKNNDNTADNTPDSTADINDFMNIPDDISEQLPFN